MTPVLPERSAEHPERVFLQQTVQQARNWLKKNPSSPPDQRRQVKNICDAVDLFFRRPGPLSKLNVLKRFESSFGWEEKKVEEILLWINQGDGVVMTQASLQLISLMSRNSGSSPRDFQGNEQTSYPHEWEFIPGEEQLKAQREWLSCQTAPVNHLKPWH